MRLHQLRADVLDDAFPRVVGSEWLTSPKVDEHEAAFLIHDFAEPSVNCAQVHFDSVQACSLARSNETFWPLASQSLRPLP